MNYSKADDAQTELDTDNLPRHVAIIMDGNGRWAKLRLLNRVRGHERGVSRVKSIVTFSRRVGIPFLTLYAFSTENWQRPKAEVTALMILLNSYLKSQKKELCDNNIRLNVIGEIHRLPKDVQNTLHDVMYATEANDKMILNLALSYGGRSEITQGVRLIAEKVKSGELQPEDVTQELISGHLFTRGMPDPDILIRTSGEMRISNFLLWQIAYSELFVTPTLWPDFGTDEYLDILKKFQARHRRFGKV